MKLDNKGFAVSSILYLILILALVLVSLTISLIINRKLIVDKQKKEVTNSFENKLILKKETSCNIPIYENKATSCYLSTNGNWEYSSNATADGGIFTIGIDGSSNYEYARTDFLNVNGGNYYLLFDGYIKNPSLECSPYGCIYWSVAYYDSSKNPTDNSLENRPSNGFATGYKLNEWRPQRWAGWKQSLRYGPNVKYIRFKFSVNENNWSVAPVKIKNLVLYGEKIPNTFYNIKIKLINKKTIQTIKYDYGEKNKSYFENNGIATSDNPIKVFNNGTYTVYVEDTEGNKYISTIEITDIIE